MPQPRTPRYPRHGLHSRTTWRPMCGSTAQHRRSAGCPGPRTRNELSNSAPPAYKNTRIDFGLCTGRRRDRDRHTAYSAATHRSQPPNRRQSSPNANRGPARGERTPQLAGPNGPNRSPKWPQRRRHPIRNRSRGPQHARFSHGRNVPPCTPNGQTAQKYKEYTEPRLKGNRNNLYGSGARYRADWPHRANTATYN